MGILDEAIKEHLELKRQHGAAEDELKQLEDEAFGAAERPGGEVPPDAATEAPTEFMAQPDLEQPSETPAEAEQAAPEAEPEAESPSVEEPRRPSPRTEIADLQEAPPAEAEQSAADEEQPAAEHEIVGGPTTAEREAIAEQPTELHDVEAELGEEEDDFWDEKRLSDELDQALEAPSEDEPQAEAASEDSEEDEDVLEETPDFLEEAPEDDQLWFEQKPPKDFDFDD